MKKEKSNKNTYFKLSTKPEKIVAASALSLAAAIIFDEKKKKIKRPQKYHNLWQRTARNYKIADAVLTKTIAKDINKKVNNKFKSETLNKLDIESGEFIDI